MTQADVFLEQFQELCPEIESRRKSDPVFDEICCDFEELTTLADKSRPITDGSLEKDFRSSIRALRDEIRARLKTPNQ